MGTGKRGGAACKEVDPPLLQVQWASGPHYSYRSVVGHQRIVSSPAGARMRNMKIAELSRSACRDIT